MKFLVVVACIVVLASAKSFSGKNAQFEAFKKQFGKSYQSAVEEEFRQKIFLNNVKIIADHSKLHKAGKVSFDLAINKFADLTAQEFSEKYTGFRQPATNYKPKPQTSAREVHRSRGAEPDSIDWRDYGYVTPVKDQGLCRSSYAFSTTGSLEGQHFRETRNLVSLSEQNIIDCSYDDFNEGCSGGTMDNAFSYLTINGGLDTEESYPYEATDGPCRFNTSNVGAIANTYVNIPPGDEDNLTNECGFSGPICAAIDASHSSFQLYNSGVYYEPACDPNNLNHAVLVAGYGNEGGEDYYLVKNSWGVNWGDQGYIKMSRNRDNNCGIATHASFGYYEIY